MWDIRKKGIVHLLRGHQDTVTSLSVSPDGQSLLSNSMDNSVKIWDIRAFAPTNRLQKSFDDGVQVGIEKNLIRASWSTAGDKIAAGSGDRTVVCNPANTCKEATYECCDIRLSGTSTVRKCYINYLGTGAVSMMCDSLRRSLLVRIHNDAPRDDQNS